ncbi:MAG: hypothetical protein PHF25_01750 [Candidatus Margulisbacteria bacterium]|nr:hypothetical protein [Candidatus Margulisiibacteriota bacterium]
MSISLQGFVRKSMTTVAEREILTKADSDGNTKLEGKELLTAVGQITKTVIFTKANNPALAERYLRERLKITDTPTEVDQKAMKESRDPESYKWDKLAQEAIEYSRNERLKKSTSNETKAPKTETIKAKPIEEKVPAVQTTEPKTIEKQINSILNGIPTPTVKK